MYSAQDSIPYSIGVFIIVFISGCIVNLLKHHFIYQITGIAFFFTYSMTKAVGVFQQNDRISLSEAYFASLPMFAGISACLITMVLGFWIFPPLRRKMKR